jgi:phosphoribosyl 1,2-cyclic phosphodiesterase
MRLSPPAAGPSPLNFRGIKLIPITGRKNAKFDGARRALSAFQNPSAGGLTHFALPSEAYRVSVGSDFFVRFWGVRGSIACPGPDTAVYGGNTPCVEMRCGEHLLIFDAGTGLRELGAHIVGDGITDADLFLTHTHMDHVAGFPFFCYAFKEGNALRVHSGHLEGGLTTEGVLRQFMSAPLFPVPVDIFSAKVSYHDFRAGDAMEPKPGVSVTTASLNHPQNATGYRVDFGGKSICYVTDTEHRREGPDENILRLIDGADIVIYDGMFTDDEYPAYEGWGHSTWQEGARLCETADVGTYVIFHHFPERTDDDLDRIAEQAEATRRGTVVAREGLTLAP